MSSSVFILLGFGFWLIQWSRAQKGPLPRPTLLADPGTLIPQGKPVTLQCRGSPEADKYHLRREGSSQHINMSIIGSKADFFIPSVMPDTTGSYYCLYEILSRLSEPSEPLRIVMTGWYDKPSLSILPNPKVSSGENVTFRCNSTQWFEHYALSKKGSSLSQSPGKWYHANFFIPSVTAAHAGYYSCYSFHTDTPYEWSDPSNTVELRVTGIIDDTLLQNKTWNSADSTFNTSPQNYTVGNLIRLGLAGMVLIALGVLLVEARNSQRRYLEATLKMSWQVEPKEQGRVGTQ